MAAARAYVSKTELEVIHQRLRATAPLSEEELAALPVPERRTLATGEFLLLAGQRAKEVATVQSGGLREYFVHDNGLERTKSFNLPGDFAGSLSDLLIGAPARTWIVAETPTVLSVTPWNKYAALVERWPGWHRFARAVAENLYLRKSEREYELLALDATARYLRALQRWPTLEQVFKQIHIASYVGITPVHLSRLRKKLAAQNPEVVDD